MPPPAPRPTLVGWGAIARVETRVLPPPGVSPKPRDGESLWYCSGGGSTPVHWWRRTSRSIGRAVCVIRIGALEFHWSLPPPKRVSRFSAVSRLAAVQGRAAAGGHWTGLAVGFELGRKREVESQGETCRQWKSQMKTETTARLVDGRDSAVFRSHPSVACSCGALCITRAVVSRESTASAWLESQREGLFAWCL